MSVSSTRTGHSRRVHSTARAACADPLVAEPSSGPRSRGAPARRGIARSPRPSAATVRGAGSGAAATRCVKKGRGVGRGVAEREPAAGLAARLNPPAGHGRRGRARRGAAWAAAAVALEQLQRRLAAQLIARGVEPHHGAPRRHRAAQIRELFLRDHDDAAGVLPYGAAVPPGRHRLGRHPQQRRQLTDRDAGEAAQDELRRDLRVVEPLVQETSPDPLHHVGRVCSVTSSTSPPGSDASASDPAGAGARRATRATSARRSPRALPAWRWRDRAPRPRRRDTTPCGARRACRGPDAPRPRTPAARRGPRRARPSRGGRQDRGRRCLLIDAALLRVRSSSWAARKCSGMALAAQADAAPGRSRRS